MSEPIKPYEPEDTGYDYDEYAYEDRRGPNVLWGRIIALVVALALAFWLGRTTAGGGADEGALNELRDELEQVQQENEDLENQLAATEAEAAETPDATTTDASPDPAAEEGETYVVQRGDTLRGIAQTFCGDPQLDDLIAAENGIEDATQLSVGEEIALPADCTG